MDPTHSRLGKRAAVFALILLALSLGLLAWQDERLAAVHTSNQIERAQAVQTLVERQQRNDLTQRAELIAGDAAFSDYVGQALGGALPGVPVDTNSIVDLLAERQQQLELSVAAVVDGSGRVVAHSGLDRRRETLKGDPVFDEASRKLTVATGLWEQDGQLLHVAVIALATLGSGDGFLLVALPVKREFAQAIATGSGGAVALLRTSKDGLVIVDSTLPESTNDAVQAAARSVSKPGARVALDVDGESRRGFTSKLLGSDAGMVVVLPPPESLTGLTRASRLPWLLGTLLLALGLGVAGWWILRNVLRPVDAISKMLDRTSSGDFHLQFRESDAGAMTGLAAAFNRMTTHMRR